VLVAGDPVDGAGHRRGIGAAGDGLVAVRRERVRGGPRSAQDPGPHERDQQQRRKHPCPRRRDGGPADDDLRGGAGRGDASMGTWRGAGLPGLRHRLHVLHDLLMKLGVGQDREQFGCPPRHTVVTPVLAGTALAQVTGQGQPQGSGQHNRGAPTILTRIAIVAASISQHLPQFPAPGSPGAGWINGGFGGEGGDLEGAQDGLPVLATQSTNPGDGRPELQGCVPAVQASRHEQVVHPLPRFWQRGDDALQPLPQRCQPRGRLPHFGSADGNAGSHRLPVNVIRPAGLPRRWTCLGGDGKQPATQAIRTRQLGGIGHGQAGDRENAGRGGDGRVSVGP
jgi:hypothetical protein